MDYSPAELMTINAARLLRDGDVVFVGVGLPNLACNLARRTHAPNLTLVYEAGVIGAQPARLPLSIGDPTLVSGAASICSMYEIFSLYLQRGLIDVGFLGGAQIDRFGNVNATVIGDYHMPKVRLPGSGGSAEIAAWAKRIYFITPHQARRFPAKCDFVTGYGYRAPDAGLVGGGPQAVVTDIGILTPAGGGAPQPVARGELTLTALHPGRTVEEARANTGWPLHVANSLTHTDPPSRDELRLLREELDPTGIYLHNQA
jgi:glutaconate CoA-transferase subunit B